MSDFARQIIDTIIRNPVICNLYLPLTVFIAQALVGPSKQLEQIIYIEHTVPLKSKMTLETRTSRLDSRTSMLETFED